MEVVTLPTETPSAATASRFLSISPQPFRPSKLPIKGLSFPPQGYEQHQVRFSRGQQKREGREDMVEVATERDAVEALPSLQEEPCSKKRRGRSTDAAGDVGVLDLPDDAVENILSFLPLNAHIRVCASSSRFANTWLWSRNLDFGGDFSRGRGPAEVAEAIDRVLAMHRRPTLRTFHLASCGGSTAWYSSKLDGWLGFASARDVEELDLDFSKESFQFDFPCHLFACDGALRVLKLSFCRLTTCLGGLCGLRVLVLDGVNLHEPGSTKAFELSSPCLEVVDVRGCTSIHGFKVSSPHGRLRSMSVVHCRNQPPVDFDIAAPGLSSISYRGGIRGLTIPGDGEMGTLDDVSLFFTDDAGWDREWVKKRLHRLVQSTRALSTNSRVLECLVKRPTERWPTKISLPHLVEFNLSMEIGSFLNVADIVLFLVRCPSLQRIQIDLGRFSFNCGSYWVRHGRGMLRQLNHSFSCLRAITIRGFKPQHQELMLLKLFQEKAPNLEIMHLITSKKGQLQTHRRGVQNDLRFGNAKIIVEEPRRESTTDYI